MNLSSKKNRVLNILEFLGLFVMSMCSNLKELNLMQKQENAFFVFDEISLYYEGMVIDQKGAKNLTPNIMELDITDNLSEKQGERGS